MPMHSRLVKLKQGLRRERRRVYVYTVRRASAHSAQSVMQSRCEATV